MSIYKKLIVAATNCDPDEARFIEDVMRDRNGGTLDHLSAKVFAREAKLARAEVPAIRQAVPTWNPL